MVLKRVLLAPFFVGVSFEKFVFYVMRIGIRTLQQFLLPASLIRFMILAAFLTSCIRLNTQQTMRLEWRQKRQICLCRRGLMQKIDARRDLDHGAKLPLMLMCPQDIIPLIQISI